MTKKLFLLFAVALLSVQTATEAADRPGTLKLAVIAPVLDWDDAPEIKRLTEWMEGHYNLKVTWIQPEHPPQSNDKQVQKAYHRNPPPVKNLDKALDADVVYAAITHVHLNKADTLTYFKLLMTKPIVAGKRAHSGLLFSMDKDQELPDEILAGLGDIKVENSQRRWSMAVFGCVMGGHHGGKVNVAEGQADHPIIQGLDNLWQHRMTKRGYKYKQMAPDVKVVIESEGMPQIWVRDEQPGVDRRLVYVGYDPEDFDKHDSLRQLMARAVFWAAGKPPEAYKER